MTNKYDDIINLPHHESKNHPKMSAYDRSAQFAPFAALVGYGDSINEASREVDERMDLAIDKIDEISKKLFYIQENISLKPIVKVIYFTDDKNKKGGQYNSIESTIIKINQDERTIIFLNKKKISFEDIFDIFIL